MQELSRDKNKKVQKNEIYLRPDCYYHVYNRAVGDEKLFYTEKNYTYFLKKYSEHIPFIADTFAYCLMPNHFHFLIKIKSEKDVTETINEKSKNTQKNMDTGLFISKQFSNLFNGYSQAINKQEMRNGTLFSRAFKRKQIDSLEYMRNVLVYIHQNPVNHGFTDRASEWKFSSYNSIVSGKDLLLKRDEVVNWFDDLDNLIKNHHNYNLKHAIEFE